MKITSAILKPLCAVIIMLSVTLLSCNAANSGNLFINCFNPQLVYMGRVATLDSSKIIYWSGSSIQMNFEGTSVKALLKDERGLNYFYVIIDGKPTSKIKVETEKKLYTLVSDLAPGKHTLQLNKLTEGSHGKTWFYGFYLNNGAKILEKPTAQKRKIEYYGNSITSGYSLEDTLTDSRKPEYFNNYLSYAALTARHFDAAYHCICKSGIGVMVSYFPIIMPELYDRVDPDDATNKWDFTKFTPDVVVVNLFSNDLDLINQPKDENFIARFGTKKPDEDFIVNAYKNFIQTLRNKYPNASIICTLDAWKDPESDGHKFPGYIAAAVAQLKDPKIFTHFFDYKKMNKRGHPKAKDHQNMAASLIAFIDGNIKW